MLHALPSFAKSRGTSTPQTSQDASSTLNTASKSTPEASGGACIVIPPTKTHLSPTDVPAFIKPGIPKPKPASGKIAERVRSINDLQGQSSVIGPPFKPADTASLHHKVSPATTSRAQPFIRRDASANQVKTDVSHVVGARPESGCDVHSPIPTRSQPRLPVQIEEGVIAVAHYPSGVGADDYNHNNRNSTTNVRPMQTEVQLAGQLKPTTEPAQTRDRIICPRHGRNLPAKKRIITTTTDGLERSISGAYIPTGRKLRHQCDAVNPWVLSGRCLAKKEGTTVSPELCPDCVTEQNVLTRELSRPLHNDSLDFDHQASETSSPITLGPSSIVTEPGTPTGDTQDNVLIGTTRDHQMVSKPGAAVSGFSHLSLDDVGTVIAADLGNMLDAIIIEHKGSLDKVITNIRDGVPGPDRMQKLSQDIAKVSTEVASVPQAELRAPNTFIREYGPQRSHSMILDVNPTLLRRRTRSIPLLLELIDATAEELGLNLPELVGDTTTGVTKRVVSTGQLPTEHIHGHRAVGTTLHLPGGMSPYILTPNGSVSNTALPTPDATYVPSQLGDHTPRITPSSPDVLTPGSVRLPSEILQSRDFVPNISAPDKAVSAPPSAPISSSGSPSSNAGSKATVTRGLSRIPSLKQSPNTPPAARPAPRAYRSNPGTKQVALLTIERRPSTKLAPYQNSSGKSVRATSLVRPSEVLSKQKQQQRTFEQEWLRDFSHASSRAERSERRGRAESLGKGLGHEDGMRRTSPVGTHDGGTVAAVGDGPVC